MPGDMPLSYEIDQEVNRVEIIGSGDLTFDDVMRLQDALSTDDRVRPGMLSLVDLREVKFKITGREILNLALSRDKYSFFTAQGGSAIVVSSPVVFAMSRMYALSRRRFIEPMAIFYEMDEALKWLEEKRGK